MGRQNKAGAEVLGSSDRLQPLLGITGELAAFRRQ